MNKQLVRQIIYILEATLEGAVGREWPGGPLLDCGARFLERRREIPDVLKDLKLILEKEHRRK